MICGIARQFKQWRLWRSVILALATVPMARAWRKARAGRLDLVIRFGTGLSVLAMPRGSPGTQADSNILYKLPLLQPNGRYAVCQRYVHK